MSKNTQGKDFTTSFVVAAAPEAVFAAINDVRGWWGGRVEGCTTNIGDEFTYTYDSLHYSKQRIVESIPGKKIVWLVLDATLTFVDKQSEWKGTKIVFELTPTTRGTALRFTHEGLIPAFECYEGCSGGWRHYIDGSLKAFIAKVA